MPTKTTVLLLLANPVNTDKLDLEGEFKQIEQIFRKSDYRDDFTVHAGRGVTIDELQPLVERHKPNIIHFSGHGTKEGLFFEDNNNFEFLVPNKALGDFIQLVSDTVQCVVLSSCYSERLAEEISQHIAYTIGIKGAIGDGAAIRYSAGFYHALSGRKDIAKAHYFGRNAIALANLADEDMPILLEGNQTSQINPVISSSCTETQSRIVEEVPCDIFVSYADVDNSPPPTIKFGWISLFIQNLEWGLGKQIGKKDAVRIYMDDELNDHAAISPKTKEKIQQAKVFILFLSIGYVRSVRCQNELVLFINQIDKMSNRVFILELENIEIIKRPKVLHDLLTYPLWRKNRQGDDFLLADPEPSQGEQEYYNRISKLARKMAKKLEQASSSIENEKQWKATVYVAPVNDSLHEQREKVIDFLTQYQIQALPKKNSWSPDDREKTQELLETCSHFIQLLDEKYNLGTHVYLNSLAEKEQVKNKVFEIIQWRNHTLSRTEVEREEQEALLYGENVIADTLTDFQQEILTRILPKKKRLIEQEDEHGYIKKSAKKETIFINTGLEDLTLAREIAELLQKEGYGYRILRYDTDPEEIRERLKQYIQQYSYMLMIQKETPVTLIEQMFNTIERARDEHTDNITYSTILCQKVGRYLDFCPPGIEIVNCIQDFNSECCNRLLELLEQRG